MTGCHFVLCRADGHLEKPIAAKLSRLPFKLPCSHEIRETTAITTPFYEGDVLLIASDGLEFNIDCTRHYAGEETAFGGKELAAVIRENAQKTIVEIRDALIEKFGDYFLPGKLRKRHEEPGHYDDVTFAVVKREYRKF